MYVLCTYSLICLGAELINQLCRVVISQIVLCLFKPFEFLSQFLFHTLPLCVCIKFFYLSKQLSQVAQHLFLFRCVLIVCTDRRKFFLQVAYTDSTVRQNFNTGFSFRKSFLDLCTGIKHGVLLACVEYFLYCGVCSEEMYLEFHLLRRVYFQRYIHQTIFRNERVYIIASDNNISHMFIE